MWYIVMFVLIVFAMICGFFLSLSMDKYLESHDID